MRFGGTGGNHHPIQSMVSNNLGNLALGILGAAEKIFFGIHHIRQGFGKFDHLGDIDKSGDIGAAAANKYPDPWRLTTNIGFLDRFFGFCPGSANIEESASNLAGRRAGFDHRGWNILGGLIRATDINTRSGCLDRIKPSGLYIVIMIQFDPQVFR